MSNLSDFVGGAKVFIPEQLVSNTISTGPTGDILDVTVPAGKVVMLVTLSTTSTTADSNPYSLIVDGNTVYSGGINDSSPSTNRLSVGVFGGGVLNRENLPVVYAKESLKLNRAGTGAQPIQYGYVIGSFQSV